MDIPAITDLTGVLPHYNIDVPTAENSQRGVTPSAKNHLMILMNDEK